MVCNVDMLRISDLDQAPHLTDGETKGMQRLRDFDSTANNLSASDLGFRFGALLHYTASIPESLSILIILLEDRLQIKVKVLSESNIFLEYEPKERKGVVRQDIDSIRYG